MKDKILIFTDGACSGNPGPGGWGAIIAFPDGKIKELGGKKTLTTNNEMEMLACLEAIKRVVPTDFEIDVYTDSTYLIRGITQWIWGWQKKNWQTSEGKEVANQNLWKSFLALFAKNKGLKINWNYSRGHIGIPGNERCDEIAVAFSKSKYIELFEGNLLNYSIAIFDLPEDTSLPEMKSKTEKKVAYSYLSSVGGVVYRHENWPSCERRVKGQSGAKFKKAFSAQEELDILNTWGLTGSEIKQES